MRESEKRRAGWRATSTAKGHTYQSTTPARWLVQMSRIIQRARAADVQQQLAAALDCIAAHLGALDDEMQRRNRPRLADVVRWHLRFLSRHP